MKKYLIVIVFIISLCTVGCGKYDLKMDKLATDEEMEKFFEEKDVEFDDEIELSFEMEVEGMFYSSNFIGEIETEIEGRMIIDEDGKMSYAYEGKGKIDGDYGNVAKSSSVKGKLKEKGIIIANNNYTHNMYIDLDYTIKGDDFKLNYDKKTNEDNSAYLYQIFEQIFEDSGMDSPSDIEDQKVYIDGDDCTVVYSTTEMHVEMVLLFDDEELESMKMTMKTAELEAEIIFEFDDVDDIEVPKDYKDYK